MALSWSNPCSFAFKNSRNSTLKRFVFSTNRDTKAALNSRIFSYEFYLCSNGSGNSSQFSSIPRKQRDKHLYPDCWPCIRIVLPCTDKPDSTKYRQYRESFLFGFVPLHARTSINFFVRQLTLMSERQTKVKSILVSQPEPTTESHPFFTLAEKHKVDVDFRSFIHVEGVTASNFRKDKIQIREFRNVILTSKNAVDHYFRMCEEMRVQISPDTRYFCISEAIAYYLQKYVVYRKRKIYHGNLKIEELIPTLKKFKNEKFLMPSSNSLKPSIPEALEEANIDYTRAILFNTVVSDLSDLEDVFYDVLVFFSPSGIKSLYENFPSFKQNNTRLACFGPTTQKEAENNGLIVDIPAPTPDAPSMTKAISDYMKVANKK